MHGETYIFHIFQLLLGFLKDLNWHISFEGREYLSFSFMAKVGEKPKHLVPGANTWNPTHDKVMREKTWQARQIRFSRISKRPAHETPPMTRSWGENLTGKADQVFRDSKKLPPALTLKMISVFLMLASIDYSLISVTQAEGLPQSLSK